MDHISDTRGWQAAIWRTSPPPNLPPSRGRASGCLAMWEFELRIPRAVVQLHFEDMTLDGRVQQEAVGLYYAAARRRRPIQPSPNSALAKIAREAGSVAATKFSPLDIGALAEAVVVASWSKVVQLAAGVHSSGISVQSNLSVVP